MSRSYRKPYIKDGPRNQKRTTLYWRPVRSAVNQLVRIGIEDLPNPKTLINDYDYCDYRYISDREKDKRK